MKSDKLILNCWQSLAQKVITQAVKDATYRLQNGRPTPHTQKRDALVFLRSRWCEQLATFCDKENDIARDLEKL